MLLRVEQREFQGLPATVPADALSACCSPLFLRPSPLRVDHQAPGFTIPNDTPMEYIFLTEREAFSQRTSVVLQTQSPQTASSFFKVAFKALYTILLLLLFCILKSLLDFGTVFLRWE